MEDQFQPWTVATSRREASEEMAKRIEEMQRLYRETVALADTFAIPVSFDLSSPIDDGHNKHGHYVHWSQSAQHC